MCHRKIDLEINLYLFFVVENNIWEYLRLRDDKFGRDLLRRKIFPGKIIYFSISFTTKKNSTHRRAIKLKENDVK